MVAMTLALAAPVGAQTVSPTGGTAPPAAPADVATVDGIIAALYDVISGPAGQARNWDRFRSLFVPEAKLIPTGFPQGSTTARARYLSVEDYVTGSGPSLQERGFYERETGRVSERFENIVHAFSSYESRRTPDGEVIQRGINSIQLTWDGERWWVANIMWRGVGPNVEIPPKYLKTP
jgi:hypothetical protein